ncbi:LysR family transcriptional regulator [Marinimicrobium alkaliphilum]|uniref:LysR family transcriptional regulator n=1 Tax=Marinimicrobium alkaliphilum TaxID=2202654 RepID=UPI000DBA6C57|nr:LysR family transcriptional regulator [Marinimicrobium alkaliphilum]
MTAKQLRAFLAVAENFSFAQACEQLHMSQSALSLSIKALEDSLGGALFSRTTRSVRLTPEGLALLPLARRLLAEWDNIEGEMQQRFSLQQGQVTVACMPSFAGNMMPEVIRNFVQRYPRINVKIQDVVNEQVIEMVSARQVEIGVGFELPSSSPLTFATLFVDQFVAVVPRDSTLSHQESVAWSELIKEPFITLQRPSSVRLMLEQQLAERGLRWKVTLESHQLATIGSLVAAGLGVSVVPNLCQPQMTALGAVCKPLSDPAIQKPVGIITRRDHELSVAAQSFFDALAGLRKD